MMFRRALLLLALAIAGLTAPLARPAQAALITYSLTGNMTGSLNGTNFANTAFTMTLTGDTANQTNIIGGQFPAIPGALTIQISGFALATATAQMYVVNINVGSPDTIGFLNNVPDQGIDFQSAATDGYAFGLIAPTAVTFFRGNLIQTDQGTLVINEQTAPPTNLVFSAAAVPEPASLALLGPWVLGGLAGIAAVRRRRGKA